MIIQLKKTCKGMVGKNRMTWQKGQIFDDAIAAIPQDILNLAKANDPSVNVLGRIDDEVPLQGGGFELLRSQLIEARQAIEALKAELAIYKPSAPPPVDE